MTNPRKKLDRIVAALQDFPAGKIRLFFVTRHVKPGITRTKRMLAKYVFRTLKVDLSAPLQSYFGDLIAGPIRRTLSDENVELVEYSVIDDDTDGKIYTYALNEATAFSDVVTRQLKKGVDVENVQCLNIIKPFLWAYCVRADLPAHKEPIFFFRRFTQGKVVTDGKKGLEKIVAAFDTDDAKLDIVKGETLNLDDKLDCVFFEGTFYVLRKTAFELMVGLEEEFRSNAESVVETVAKADVVDDIERLSELVLDDPVLLRKIAHISRVGGHRNLTAKRIRKMKEIASRFKENLKVINGKLIVEDRKDATLILKMLGQYYVECMQTGEPFGSHAKKRLTATR